MVQKFLTTIFLLALLFSIGLYLYVTRTYPQVSPLNSGRYVIESLIFPHKHLDKYVMGFLPYWNMDSSQFIKPEDLSEINYFSLTPGTDGHILKVVDGQTDPGWRDWQSEPMENLRTKAQIYGTNIGITISALDDNLISSILDSAEAQQNLVDDIVKEVQDKHLKAVTIDFEYSGTVLSGYPDKFTSFSKHLRTALDKNAKGTQLSLSLMPLAIREDNIYNFSDLVPIYDHFVGMSYEYYGQGADISAPVAPMQGFKEGKYFFDVTTTYEDYLKYLPKNKIIMGVPYYGWERAVLEAKTPNSPTYASDNEQNYAVVISYARAKESSDIKPNQCTWDSVAEETWCWFIDKASGTARQAWIADNKSVETRFNYAKKEDFGGIALWTLGYDKQYLDLWELIVKKFTHQ